MVRPSLNVALERLADEIEKRAVGFEDFERFVAADCSVPEGQSSFVQSAGVADEMQKLSEVVVRVWSDRYIPLGHFANVLGQFRQKLVAGEISPAAFANLCGCEVSDFEAPDAKKKT